MLIGYIYETITGKTLDEPAEGQDRRQSEEQHEAPPCCDNGIAYVLIQGIIDGMKYIRDMFERPRDPLSGAQVMLFTTLEDTIINFSTEPDRHSLRTGGNPNILYLSYKGEEFATAYGSRLDISDESVMARHPDAEKLIDTINHCIYHKDDIEVFRDVKEKDDTGTGRGAETVQR